MKFKHVAILTSRDSWFVPYAKRLASLLNSDGYRAKVFFDHKRIDKKFEVVFALSYFKLIEPKYLKEHKYNLVVHESALPKGRGWAPLFWSILEGRNKIPVVLFDAASGADSGDIYLKDKIVLKGDELYDDIRKIQADKTVDLCLKFLKRCGRIKPVAQSGNPTYYRRRIPGDNELSMRKSLSSQFDLLRISNNVEFPAYFHYKGGKYILKIYKGTDPLCR
jgi:methionyl-tRNA formyltransferase